MTPPPSSVGALLYSEHLRKRGRHSVRLPTEMFVGLLTAATLNRNESDSTKLLRWDNVVR
jgi:hypothetical protein